jgi:Immunity protein 53
MTNDNCIIDWLVDWYKKNCNGDWEHYYGISIKSTDNPGWSVLVDTENSLCEVKNHVWTLVEKSDNDWYGYKVENSKFTASGDFSKLGMLIEIFKQMVENDKINPE